MVAVEIATLIGIVCGASTIAWDIRFGSSC